MKRKTRLAALVLVAALCAGFITGCGAPAKPTYTVTFDLNGGELVSGELTQMVNEGENAVCPEAVNGRLALAWDKSAENITADTVITAQWSKVVMDTADLAEYVQDRTVTVNVKTITGGSGTGSGFFVDSEGTILSLPISGAMVDAYEPTVDQLLAGEAVDTANNAGVIKNDSGEYHVIVYDMDGNPVEGAFIQLCDQTTCAFQPTDAEGVATFSVGEQKVYDVHVLAAPEDYAPDEAIYKTLDTFSDVNIFLEKAE